MSFCVILVIHVLYIELKMLSVRLDKELEERLDKLSLKTNRSKSFYVKQALESYLSDMDDYFEARNRDQVKANRLLTIDDLESITDE